MTLSDIAHFLKGDLFGDGDIEIKSASPIQDAKEGDITYLSEKMGRSFRSNASAIITSSRLDIPNAQIVVKNPKSAFADVLTLFYPLKHPFEGISKDAVISGLAVMGKDVRIDAMVRIEDDVIIGDDTTIYAGSCISRGTRIGRQCIIYNNVTIRDNTIIGDRVIIHPGVVIGSDGFGFIADEGIHKKIPQVGNVIIGDDVEIGANTTIDRATVGSTIIGSGTKIDNLVQIGHNVRVGKNVIIVAQVGIGGSSVIGDNTIIAGQAGISDHTEIEPNTVIGAQSGITGKITKNIYLGSPAKPYREYLRAYGMLYKIPDMKRQLDDLETLVKSLIQKNKEQA